MLMVLQAMSDEAHDLTNELELLLDRYAMTHPHVLEVAEHLGGLLSQWQNNVARLERLDTHRFNGPRTIGMVRRCGSTHGAVLVGGWRNGH